MRRLVVVLSQFESFGIVQISLSMVLSKVISIKKYLVLQC